MIDWTRVTDLHAEIGDDGFNEIIDMFLMEMNNIVAQLQDGSNPQRIEVNLHALRGGLLNLGFTHVSALCQQGEVMAAKGFADQVDTASIVQGYDASCNLLLSELTQRVGKVSAG
jgi:HPt (histidine-containing phosphotransfer) domain-containing protein